MLVSYRLYLTCNEKEELNLKILVTGATGFVGKAVTQKLDKYTVCLTARREPLGNFAEFFEKIISSTTDFSDCLANIDVVIHTAARVHQMNDKCEDPLSEFMEVNCFGTLNFARQAVKAGVKRFIFLSSIKVNGEKTERGFPFRFDDNPAAQDAYGVSKAKAEEGLLEIARTSNLEIVIIRPPLVYGSGVKANFQSLMKLSQLNLPLPLGGLCNRRSFVAIENLVDLIIICIDHPNAANKVFLISDNSDISTTELLSLMADAFGRKAIFLNISPRILKFVARCLGKESIIERLCNDLQIDIKHTQDTLGWTPPMSMTDSIRRCAEYLENID